ncbi:hypothetical protein EVAR_76633_1 [Eumeta japonica]|uniref:Uncharacterized protein n=1 Tax=Eumeta variegata TaxID=151549 RepID=A0A4C1T586_EUMVA|nr:hypothetical protein EVAR_76633_1 [Eumeta japonica]
MFKKNCFHPFHQRRNLCGPTARATGISRGLMHKEICPQRHLPVIHLNILWALERHCRERLWASGRCDFYGLSCWLLTLRHKPNTDVREPETATLQKRVRTRGAKATDFWTARHSRSSNSFLQGQQRISDCSGVNVHEGKNHLVYGGSQARLPIENPKKYDYRVATKLRLPIANGCRNKNFLTEC